MIPRLYLVKLEYAILAPSPEEAVDTLTAAIREYVDLGHDNPELLRTDVRRHGESAEW